jgi:hypothetical protein
MTCRFLDSGPVPNRDAYSRRWRDRISLFVDLLPKANGLANGEEGTHPEAPYQANYIKSLKRLEENVGDDADPRAYCDYLRILSRARLRQSNEFEDVDLQGDEAPPDGLQCEPGGMPPPRLLTNPQSGLAISIEGPDPSGVNLHLFRNAPRSLRPAPRIDGLAAGSVTRAHENTAEAVELYWMALLRDLPFRRWTLPNAADRRLPDPPDEWKALEDDGATIDSALVDLDAVNQYFAEPYPVGGGDVTLRSIFRGAAHGDQFGPFLSQFLLRGNTVHCARRSHIRSHPRDGVIPEGNVPNLQRQATVEPYVDFLRVRDRWRCVEQGFHDPSGTDPLECEGGRFIRNLRDLANWVHVDNPAQHFRNAALLLLNEPPLATKDVKMIGRTPPESFTAAVGEERGGSDPCRPQGRPFPMAPCNPYVAPNPDSRTQMGFVTFGTEHVLNAIGDVADLALRAAWWQKWFVHRRLRPEEFGGLVDAWWRKERNYQIDPLLRDFEGLFSLIYRRNAFTDDAKCGGTEEGQATYLLPQVFPEGSPTHPAYPSGHATISGACATLLKAFFDTGRAMTCPEASDGDPTSLPPAFVASDDGCRLETATENDEPLYVGNELDKLASNISIGRNAAGVHWRSDATQGMELGEAVATYFLYETAWSLNEESFCFSFRRFFRPEHVTIARSTTLQGGTETRRVEWRVQPLGADGELEGEAEVLVRELVVDV